MRRLLASVGVTLIGSGVVVLTAPAEPGNLAGLLARVGQRVQQYFARAQSIMCRETVTIWRLQPDLMPDGGHVRTLVYELRIAWTPPTAAGEAPEANVLRELVSIDGRPPSLSKDPDCHDPRPVSPEPLVMLLANRQAERSFKWAGQKRSSTGSTVTLDYQSLKRQTPELTFHEDCASVELEGWWRGRVWIDGESADVMRIDEHLTGPVELPIPKAQSRKWFPATSLNFDRVDSSLRYAPVTFRDPEETLILPQSFQVLQTGSNRLRVHHTFTDYRRFVTGGRVIPTTELQQ
jgi:hypothetical protein